MYINFFKRFFIYKPFLLLIICSACDLSSNYSKLNDCNNQNSCHFDLENNSYHHSCFSWELIDLNTTSLSFNSLIGPNTWENNIRLVYFSNNEQ